MVNAPSHNDWTGLMPETLQKFFTPQHVIQAALMAFAVSGSWFALSDGVDDNQTDITSTVARVTALEGSVHKVAQDAAVIKNDQNHLKEELKEVKGLLRQGEMQRSELLMILRANIGVD